jgi:NADP-dependent 3-hydroxy acid dehydrogenase YdfG
MAGESGIAKGAVALVTGAGTGIGAAVAERLAERGCKVICAGRRLDRVEAVAKKIGAGAIAARLDVDAKAECEAFPAKLPRSHRDIDILVNNAGHDLGGRVRFDQGRIEDFLATITTNITGLVRLTHAVLPGMLARGRGDVVNLGSTAGLRTATNLSIYAATKAFVHSVTEGLRADYKDTDLRFIEVLPGITRTEFGAARYRGDRAKADAMYAKFPAVMAPDDIARAVVYALDQPRAVTVAAILVLPTREI